MNMIKTTSVSLIEIIGAEKLIGFHDSAFTARCLEFELQLGIGTRVVMLHQMTPFQVHPSANGQDYGGDVVLIYEEPIPALNVQNRRFAIYLDGSPVSVDRSRYIGTYSVQNCGVKAASTPEQLFHVYEETDGLESLEPGEEINHTLTETRAQAKPLTCSICGNEKWLTHKDPANPKHRICHSCWLSTKLGQCSLCGGNKPLIYRNPSDRRQLICTECRKIALTAACPWCDEVKPLTCKDPDDRRKRICVACHGNAKRRRKIPKARMILIKPPGNEIDSERQ